MKIVKSDIFNIGATKEEVICPPEQVFKLETFEFLFTIGGHLVDNEIEYRKLMTTLKDIEETQFMVTENIGATLTERTIPFEAVFSVNSSLEDFDKKISEFDENFMMVPWHFFVNGESNKWGIYVSAYPTILVIGCIPEIANDFREVYEIKGYGLDDLETFIAKEFKSKPELYNAFKRNYNLKTTPQQTNKPH